MRKFVCFMVLIAVGLLVPYGNDAEAFHAESRYMAFCIDGDGDLSGWVETRRDAILAAREHEGMSRGHRWELLTQGGSFGFGVPSSCSVISPARRPGFLRLYNSCGECMVFTVKRTKAGEEDKEREFTLQGNSRRFFRAIEGTELTVTSEGMCPGS